MKTIQRLRRALFGRAPGADPVRRADRVVDFTCALQPGYGAAEVRVRVAVPTMPRGAQSIRFMEHVRDLAGDREPTDDVICAAHDGVVVSRDLGETWRHVPLPDLVDFRVRNIFTTAEGLHLVQDSERQGSGDIVRLALYDPDWTLISMTALSSAPWHGPRAIDEANGVIMFAEYPNNNRRGVPNEPDQELDHDKDPRVFRSRDGGRTWDVAMQKSWRDIRHFHTLMADPYHPGCWWASSGDFHTDCYVWRSDDDGDTWVETSMVDPTYDAPKVLMGRRQAAYRYTDAVILPDGMLWGSDDWLGGTAYSTDPTVQLGDRGGSRIFWAPRGDVLKPEVRGFIGSPVRSMIDVGPAWMVLTEAKTPDLIKGAQVCLLSKAEPMTLQQVYSAEVLAGRKSGFSYSFASTKARNGRFFTQRGSQDLFPGGPRILQWDIAFV